MSAFRANLLFMLFVLISVLSNPATAMIPTQQLDAQTKQLEKFTMGYFIDTSESLPFDKIKQEKFTPSKNGIALGTHAKVTWAKIKIKNTSNKTMKFFLHNPYAFHNGQLALYEVVENKLIAERTINLNKRLNMSWIYQGSAVFDITLPANENRDLYIKSIPHTHQWFSLNLYDADASKRALQSQFTEIAFAIGILITLMIYNLLLFFSSRSVENLYYALYLLSAGIWIAGSYGLISDLFDLYGEQLFILNLNLLLMPVFLLSFMLQILESKKNSPIARWALILTIYLFLITFFYGLYDTKHALTIANYLAALMMTVSLSVTLSMLINKQPTAFTFLLGHGSFIAFSTVSLLFYMGKVEFNYLTIHGVGIGILIEAITLSIIVAYRVRTLKNLKEHQVNLRLLASTDSLTKLFNRRHFNELAQLALTKSRVKKSPVSIAIIDIDRFKTINDTYGHIIGDQSLKALAKLLKAQSAKYDIVARYGGEEFVILMPGVSKEQAYSYAEQIRKATEAMRVECHQKSPLKLTISIGIAQFSPESKSIKETLNKADIALYKAKQQGRNQTQVYKK